MISGRTWNASPGVFVETLLRCFDNITRYSRPPMLVHLLIHDTGR